MRLLPEIEHRLGIHRGYARFVRRPWARAIPASIRQRLYAWHHARRG